MSTHINKWAYVAGMLACVPLTPALADSNSYSVGVEGFYDNYKEPDATVNNKAYYGSLTGNYTHNWTGFFAALDARASFGEDKYSSEDGSVSGVPQEEYELRERVGYSFNLGSSNALSPYFGLGERYFRDDFKGYDTTADGNTYGGYDRRIFQFYLPVGATFEHTTAGGWTIAPNLEYDQLLWGQVSSRLGTLGQGYQNIINTQENGYGARGSFMVGQTAPGGRWSWQVGPFVRYWDIRESNAAAGRFFIQNNREVVELFDEPHNTRLQAGLQARILW